MCRGSAWSDRSVAGCACGRALATVLARGMGRAMRFRGQWLAVATIESQVWDSSSKGEAEMKLVPPVQGRGWGEGAASKSSDPRSGSA